MSLIINYFLILGVSFILTTGLFLSLKYIQLI